MSSPRGDIAQRYLKYAGLVLAIWTIGAAWLIPLVIGQAYRGESIATLNALLAGRDFHPVSHYLQGWRSIAVRSSIVLAIVALGGYALVRWRGAELGRILVREPTVSSSTGFLLTSGLGLALGFLEFAARTARYLVDDRIVSQWHPDLFWMTPITLGAMFAIGFVPFALFGAVARRRISLHVLSISFLFLGLIGVIRTLQLGIHPTSVALLAGGLAAVLTGGLVRITAGNHRRIRRGVVAVIALFLLATLGLKGGRSLREHWVSRHLPHAADALPNVLFIILDTVRAQSLSLYGYSRPTTPNLERLARRGITFDRAIASAPWTLPTHASFFTGRHPYEHRANGITPLDSRYPTIAEFLAVRGYATAAFVANLGYTSRTSGLDRGFIHYDDYELRPAAFVSSTWLGAAVGDWAMGKIVDRQPIYRKWAPDINAAFLRWLDRRPQRPFFVFLNYFDAHGAFRRHPGFLRRFPPLRGDSVIDADGRWRPRDPWNRHELDSYDSSIAFLDDQLGRLFDELERRALLEHSLIVVTSDHGELFGEYGQIGHGKNLYMPLLHVPLVIVPPGSRHRSGPLVRRRDEVSLRDLPATITHVLDLDGSAVFPGRSLLAGDAGAGADRTSADPVFSELAPEIPSDRNDGVSIVDDGMHYIRLRSAEKLYALDTDPKEAKDLARLTRSRAILRLMRDHVSAARSAIQRIARASPVLRR